MARAKGIGLTALYNLALTFKEQGKTKAEMIAEAQRVGGYANPLCVEQRLHKMRAKIEKVGEAPDKGPEWVAEMLEGVKFDDARRGKDDFGDFLNGFNVGTDGVARPKNKGEIKLGE